MALSVTARGSGTNNASNTSFNVSPSGNFAAGSFGVLLVTADNGSSGGATNDQNATLTDSLGNTWTKRTSAIYDNGAASAGIQGAIYTSSCSAGAPQTSTTIPVATATAIVAKGWSLYEVIPSGGNTVAYFDGGVGTAATAANPTQVSSSVLVGDVSFFAYHGENVSAVTGDADSTNGTWGTLVSVTVGTTTSGIRHASQHKIQTTTASTQSWTPTVASQDCVTAFVVIHEVVNTSLSPSVAALTTAMQTSPLGFGLSPSVASLVTTMRTPPLGFGFSPAVASLTAAGVAPTLTIGQTVSPSVASLTATGIAPRVDHLIASVPASLTATGIAPTLTISDNQSASPSVASLVTTGVAPRLDLSLPTTIASLALTGQTSTVTATAHVSVSPGIATLTATGETSTVSTPVTVSPAAASVAVVGSVPSVDATAHVSASPSVGTLTLTAATPTVTVSSGNTVTPSVATLTATGVAPTVTASDHVRLTPSVASLALSAQTPTVTTPRLVTPSVASLTLTLRTPTVATPRTASPAAASLAITAQTPSVSVSDNPVPIPASLVLVGEIPSVVTTDHVVVNPAAVLLELVAYAPIVEGDPPIALSDGFTVDVGLSAVPMMGVSINGPAASVAFAADQPVEVEIS